MSAAADSAARSGPVRWLAGVRVVATKELGAYFDSSIAAVYLVVGLVVLGTLFMNGFFLAGRLDMTPLFEDLGRLSVVLLPAMTMRLWAEDKKARTFELWMTLPLSPLQVVLGKYLAAAALYALFLAGTLPVVAMLLSLGTPDLGLIAAGYLGALLLGLLLLAAGMLLSALTTDQIVAFVAGVLVAFVLVGSGEPRFVAIADGLVPGLQLGTWLERTVSALPHYRRFLRGLVDPGSVVYFLGLAAALLWLNEWVVRRQRA
jgi:ABC-2 type transport system permease protein